MAGPGPVATFPSLARLQVHEPPPLLPLLQPQPEQVRGVSAEEETMGWPSCAVWQAGPDGGLLCGPPPSSSQMLESGPGALQGVRVCSRGPVPWSPRPQARRDSPTSTSTVQTGQGLNCFSCGKTVGTVPTARAEKAAEKPKPSHTGRLLTRKGPTWTLATSSRNLSARTCHLATRGCPKV